VNCAHNTPLLELLEANDFSPWVHPE